MTNNTTKTPTKRGKTSKVREADEANKIVDQVTEDNEYNSVKESAVTESKIENAIEKPKEERTKSPTRVIKEKKSFSPDDYVICRSVTSGHLYMDGLQSSMPYTWLDFGDEVGVEYRDLVAAARTKNSYIMTPFFVIMDDDFVAEFPFLKEVYSGQYTANDLAHILTLSVDEMTDAIKKLPGNVKETLKGIASTWISNGKLDSFKKIKALDEILDTDLSLIADMYND